MIMRAVFHATDKVTEDAIDALSSMLQSWGLQGSSSEAVRYAIHYAAEAHGLAKRTPGRRVKRSPDAVGKRYRTRDKGVAGIDV
jgi:hypothetical protein